MNVAQRISLLEERVTALENRLANLTSTNIAAATLGKMKSEAKAKASRENGKRGGRPPNFCMASETHLFLKGKGYEKCPECKTLLT